MRDIGCLEQGVAHGRQDEEGDKKADAAIGYEGSRENDRQNRTLRAEFSVIQAAIASTDPLDSMSLPNKARAERWGKIAPRTGQRCS